LNSIKALALENFRSWSKFTIDDFSSRGLCLINGPNGSGKSSIRMAVEYILTDSISDGVSVNDLIKRGEKEFIILAEIETGNNSIQVVKGRTHRKAKFDLILNDETISHTNKKETQKELMNLLGISKESVLFSCIFTQNSPSFVDAPDSERKDILYDFLNLWRFEKYKEITKAFLDQLNSQKQESEIELRMSKSHLESAFKELNEFIEQRDEFDKSNQIKIATLKEELNSLNFKDTHEIKNKINLLEKEISDKSNKLDEKLLSDLNSEKLKYTEKSIKLEARLSQLKTQKDRLENNICPILDRKCTILEDEFLPELKKVGKEIKKVTSELAQLDSKINQLDQKIEKINTELELIESKHIELDKLRKILNEIEYENKILDDRRRNIKGKIRELKMVENPYFEIIKKTEAKIKNLKKEIKIHKNDINLIEGQIPSYNFWVKGFGKQGIPNLEIERVLGIIEDKTNEYLKELSGKLSVKIEAQNVLKSGDVREKISYDVLYGNHLVPVNTLSGGEKQRVKIANILAFSDLLRKFDFIILDEALDLSLDESGSEDVLSLLRDKSRDVGSIFVMSHKIEIKGMFDNVIEVG